MATEESKLIQGISIGGFRSFGQVQRIGPLSKINVFIGPNNSGKSNILLFLCRHWTRLIEGEHGSKPKFKIDKNLDAPRRNTDLPLIAGSATSIKSKRFEELRKSIKRPNAIELLDAILAQPELSHGTSMVWHDQIKVAFDSRVETGASNEATARTLIQRLSPDHYAFDALFQATKPNFSGGSAEARMKYIVRNLIAPNLIQTEWVLIPAVRQVTEAKEEALTWCGAGIINRLVELQSPDHYEQEKKDQFNGIVALLQDVTGNATARLEIPHHRKHILVHMDEKSLPLESLGTGIHELIIMAAACTTVSEQFVCIEEPELHLNPLLQRKLLKYLFEKTNNQYFITSHSAALLDTETATVFRVSYNGTETSVQLASQAGERWQICRDLGYRASDLMQANCVIWVEGPSDRVYLNHWIKTVAPHFQEGIHYSILFYGGKLLSHFSADDNEIKEFISMCHLNRNPIIIMDSDKRDIEASINSTKQRIIQEFKRINAFSWLTAGREVENYISDELFRASMAEVAEEKPKRLRLGQFDKRVSEGVDKVRLARKIVERDPDFAVLDLKEQVDRIVEFVQNANQ